MTAIHQTQGEMMKFKVAEIEVPEKEPFKHDALDRKEVVEFVSKLIQELEGPFVLALDAPWGAGKTTVVKMLMALLKNDGYTTAYCNAWRDDYVIDPLIPLVAAIDGMNEENPSKSHQNQKIKFKRVASTFVKHGLVTGVKMVTAGVFDLDGFKEELAASAAGDATNDLIDSFKNKKDSVKEFRELLQIAVKSNAQDSDERPLIFFIDELDRCRPSFAIEMLERVKHLFDVKNIVFVLSTDKKQLEAITKAVYGEQIDAPEYLRRFIDLEFLLPQPHTEAFTKKLIERFDLNSFFDKRSGRSRLQYEYEQFVKYFTLIANIFNLSLRARERCLTRLTVVLMQTTENHYLDPTVTSLLIILRQKRHDMYDGLISGDISPRELVEEISSNAPDDFFEHNCDVILEAYLIAGDVRPERKRDALDNLHRLQDSSDEVEGHERVLRLLELCNQIQSERQWGFSIKNAAKKIDLTIQIRSGR